MAPREREIGRGRGFRRVAESRLAPAPGLAIGEHRLRGVMTGSTGHSATRMGARAAQIESRQRHSIVGGADHRTGAEQLIEAHLAVEDVAADQAEAALEIERRMDLPAD